MRLLDIRFTFDRPKFSVLRNVVHTSPLFNFFNNPKPRSLVARFDCVEIFSNHIADDKCEGEVVIDSICIQSGFVVLV